MSTRTALLLTLGFLLTLSGCDELRLLASGYNCTASIERALEVRVEDAASGRPIAEGATGLARDGAFSDSLRVVGWDGSGAERVATTLGGVYERPGRYSIEIQRPGYARWDTTGVRARKGSCHVELVRLVARLKPLP
jgi:hypothetical protein